MGNGNNKNFELAARIARLSSARNRHGAVIACGGNVLSLGVNSSKTHTRSNAPSRQIHAELAALIANRTDVQGATLYSARVLRNGKLGVSKPCAYCALLLREAGIRRVVYFDGKRVVRSRV